MKNINVRLPELPIGTVNAQLNLVLLTIGQR